MLICLRERGGKKEKSKETLEVSFSNKSPEPLDVLLSILTALFQKQLLWLLKNYVVVVFMCVFLNKANSK